jgi:hypothetical protein
MSLGGGLAPIYPNSKILIGTPLAGRAGQENDLSIAPTKVVSIRLGINLFANKARGDGSPIFYSYFVMSQLYDTEIP